jgi:hypothetical protein
VNYTYISDNKTFIDDTLKLVTQQYYGKENINSLVEIIADRYLNIRDNISSLIDERLLNTATGKNLDDIGEQMNIYRLEGQSDEQYRAMIWLYILAQESDITRDDIVSLLKAFTGGEAVWVYKGYKDDVDVNMYTWCIGGVEYKDFLVGIFPINTSLRICSHGRGFFFGFNEDDAFIKGFGTITEEEGYEMTAGSLASLVYTSK